MSRGAARAPRPVKPAAEQFLAALPSPTPPSPFSSVLLPFFPPPSSLAPQFSVAPLSFRSSRIPLSPFLSFSPLTPLSPSSRLIFHPSSSLPYTCLFSPLFPFFLALLCFFSPFPRQYSRPLQRDGGGGGGEGGSERERERQRESEREREKRKGTEGLVKGGQPRIGWFALDPFYL